GVRTLEEDPTAPLVAGRQDHTVVIGIHDVGAGVDGVEGAVRKHARGTYVGLVFVDENAQLMAAGALVVRFQRKLVSDAALNSEVVLEYIGAADIRILRAQA